ncbi:MAG: hypothetical protein JO354_09655 [Verrucomicrobia bacterium]|nr:hypothetical protein [Verrucomicrobiota bacterium]
MHCAHRRVCAVLSFAVIGIVSGYAQTPGTVDLSFNASLGVLPGFPVSGDSLAIQPDGRVLIGGMFQNGTGNNISTSFARLFADGSLDPTFNVGSGTDGDVVSIALQPDGKAVVGGWFSHVNGTARNFVARITPEGTLDTTFNALSGITESGPDFSGNSGTVSAIAEQPDGKLIIGGQFDQINGVAHGNIARLNIDGTVDDAFGASVTGGTYTVNSVAVQSDGKILVGGDFTEVDGVACNYIARLNSDGSLDATFRPTIAGAGAVVLYSIAVEIDGKILLGGNFTVLNGVTRYGFARLNSDGSLDTTFNRNSSATDTVFTILPLPTGEYLIGGNFTVVNGTQRNYVARLNADGSVDPLFDPGTGPDNAVWTVAPSPGGKVLVGGRFSQVDGAARFRVARLNSDGTLDTTFVPPSGDITNPEYNLWSLAVQSDGEVIVGGEFGGSTGPVRCLERLKADGSLDNAFTGDATNDVLALALTPDGKILLGGYFYGVDGIARTAIARINSTGALDISFNVGSGPDSDVESVAIQGDGKILIGGFFNQVNAISRSGIARLNGDGSLDTTFQPGSGAGSLAVGKIIIQPDGKVIAAGHFTHFDGVVEAHLVRLNADGSVDRTFSAAIGALNEIDSIALQPDGGIVLGGCVRADNGAASDFAVLRLKSDGSLDGTFNRAAADGFVFGVAVQSDGKIVIGGYFANVNGAPLSGIARLNADGTIDGSFPGQVGTDQFDGVNCAAVKSDGKLVIGGNFTQVGSLTRNGIAQINGSMGNSGILGNISTRVWAGSGNDVPIAGMVIGGSSTKPVLFRALGPTLTRFGVSGALANPTLELHDSSGAEIAFNDDWANAANASSIPPKYRPPNPLESAIYTSLNPGAYTAIGRGVANSTGVTLMEAYDMAPSAPGSARLINISTRGFVGTGDNVMIAGLVIQSNSESVLLRALGPTLAQFGINNPLPSTTLELHNANGMLLSSNTGWKSTQEVEIAASGKAPANDTESAMIVTLAPGNYTAVVRGVNNATGIALAEVYGLN